jgi:hypothetical protein
MVDDILAKARTLNTFQRPSNHDYRGFRTWFENMKPLSPAEEEFIKRKEDLISLRQGREWSGFDALIETCIRKFHGPLTQVSIMISFLSSNISATNMIMIAENIFDERTSREDER